jgi:hypothetical protein
MPLVGGEVEHNVAEPGMAARAVSQNFSGRGQDAIEPSEHSAAGHVGEIGFGFHARRDSRGRPIGQWGNAFNHRTPLS